MTIKNELENDILYPLFLSSTRGLESRDFTSLDSEDNHLYSFQIPIGIKCNVADKSRSISIGDYDHVLSTTVPTVSSNDNDV
jgi:hypothetical protein